MIFRRYGKTILLNRQGRPPGDAAFETAGSLVRAAKGAYNTCQGSGPLYQDPTCNKTFDVKRDLRFAYQGNKLFVEGGGKLPKNPTEPCTKEADVQPVEFPTFLKASQTIGPKRLFARKKGFKLKFHAPKQIQPLPAPHVTINRYETSNEFELTLTRVK
jgi:hypothetical protein